jgi:hypothetical protein
MKKKVCEVSTQPGAFSLTGGTMSVTLMIVALALCCAVEVLPHVASGRRTSGSLL